MSGEFINPYNFVSIDDKNFKETEFVDFKRFYNDKFSGQITCRIKSVGDNPMFIPDSEEQRYAILVEDAVNKDIEKRINEGKLDKDKEYFFKVRENTFEVKEDEPSINPDLKDFNKIYQSINERNSYVKGKVLNIKVDARGGEKFCIITDDPKGYRDRAHKIMYFCKDPDGNPIIPPTSIKGMIHNMVEILSNSCMAFFENKRILYRLNPEKKIDRNEIGKVARSTHIVTDRNDNDTRILELDSAKINTGFRIEDEIPKGNAYAAIVYDKKNDFKYVKRIGNEDAMVSCCEKFDDYLKRKKRQQYCKKEKIASPISWNIIHKDDFSIELEITINGVTKKYYEPRLMDENIKELYALIYKKTIKTPRGGTFEKYYVRAVHSDLSEIERIRNNNPCYKNCEIVQARVKRSGDIETKTQDMLFFKYAEDDLEKFINGNKNQAKEISKDIVEKYEKILKDRKENLKSESKNEPDRLEVGDLVYYYEDSRSEEKYLSYTQIPRKEYENSIGDLIKNKACTDLNKLCPSCNMFGSTKTKESGKTSAISGKVSFGTGRIIDKSYALDSGRLDGPGIPLKILSSPKPSCTEFYLMPAGSYNNPDSEIRGRKLYYHHDNNKLDYKMEGGDYKDDVIRNNQNTSIEILKKFEFELKIDFVNLSKYELGLLLFALDLRNKDRRKLFHKIGMGKPLGLGTIKIEIDMNNSYKINRNTRYDNLFNDGREPLKIEDFIRNFQTEQVQIFNNGKEEKEKSNNFYLIPYVKDLFAILEVNTAEKGFLDIKYPRKKYNGEPRGFDWFVKEIKEKKKHGEEQWLPETKEIRDKDISKNLYGWS